MTNPHGDPTLAKSLIGTNVPETFAARTFRDGVRKIDLIIVTKDDQDTENEKHRVNYLINIVKFGLEIELEPGIMQIHKNVVFVKVHAPDTVLYEYGKVFGFRRFKNSRDEFLKTSYDWEWINIVRNGYIEPLRYSNLDRSLIVYMIILLLPFGERQNYIGMERLLSHNIMLDVFALHDGPYFLPQGHNNKNVNARQILFYNWAGWNVFEKQPLNLINEYFGQKIAMFFTYYGFYNQALMVAAFAAIITLILAILMNYRYTSLIGPICSNNSNIALCTYCPGWRNSNTTFKCPIKRVGDYCVTYAINILLDNKFTPYFSAFIALWGIIFVSSWKGKEQYLNWMWGTQEKEIRDIQTSRPEYELDRIKMQKSQTTGVTMHKKPYIDTFKVLAIYIIVTSWFMFHCKIILELIRLLKRIKAIHKDDIRRNLIILPIAITSFVTDILFFDNVARLIAKYLLNTENHRTYESYNRSLAAKLTWLVFTAPFFLLVCFAFEMDYFRLRFGLFTISGIHIVENCGLTSCLYQLGFVFTIILFLRFSIIWERVMCLRKTDYNQGAEVVENIPCWEREFQLQSFSEEILINKMKILVSQFTLITMFAIASPAVMLFVLLCNVFYMRRNAQLLILNYRRPLLLIDNGFGIWSKILKFMVYLAILVNVLTLMCNSNFITIYLNEKRKSVEHSIQGYIDLMFYLIVEMETPGEEKPQCYAHAFYSDDGNLEDPIILAQKTTADELRTYQYFYVFMFEHVMISCFVIAQYLFSNDYNFKEFLRK